MSRSHRLNELMQVFRRHRSTLSGQELARATGVSLRTIRRDIAALQIMGARIEGEAGVGYILRPGSVLPNMSFTEPEIQALVAGAKLVSRFADQELAVAAQNALGKIAGVIGAEARRALDDDTLYVGDTEEPSRLDLGKIRQAVRDQRKVHVVYTDRAGSTQERVIWPLIIGFVDSQRFVSAWCELRQDFLLFRVDRIQNAAVLDEHYPGNRRQLAKEWRRRFCPGRLASGAAE